MKYELTKDINFITQCLADPAVWRLGSDDAMSGISPKLFFPRLDGVVYIKAGDYGLLFGVPTNHVTLDAHVALLPSARGAAVDICRGAISWAFDNLNHLRRITSSIPEYNKLAVRLAGRVGMEFIGTNRKSFSRNGVLYDQLLFGISKGE